jgi:hypothetical protein
VSIENSWKRLDLRSEMSILAVPDFNGGLLFLYEIPFKFSKANTRHTTYNLRFQIAALEKAEGRIRWGDV